MRVVVLILIIISIPVHAQSRKEKKEAKQQLKIEEFTRLKQLLDSSLYEFTASKAQPQRGGIIDLTTRPNFLRVISDSASADLPFFGRAYNEGYSIDGGGIKFNGEIKDYQIAENQKKFKLTITFSVRSTNDTYNCTLTVFGNRYSSLSVMSQNRALITYSGLVDSFKP